MTLFEKRGRRYYPVRDTNACDGLGLGSWVVTVMRSGGCTLTTYQKLITPAFAEVLAAMPVVKEAMIEAMHAANRCDRPQTLEMTPKQRRAWEAYQAVMAEDKDVPMIFKGVSMHDVVDAGIMALQKAVIDLAENDDLDSKKVCGNCGTVMCNNAPPYSGDCPHWRHQ